MGLKLRTPEIRSSMLFWLNQLGAPIFSFFCVTQVKLKYGELKYLKFISTIKINISNNPDNFLVSLCYPSLRILLLSILDYFVFSRMLCQESYILFLSSCCLKIWQMYWDNSHPVQFTHLKSTTPWFLIY